MKWLAMGWTVRGSNPGGKRDFPHPSRPALCSIHNAVQWALGLFSGGKTTGRDVHHPPPYNAEVKERVELKFYYPFGLSGPVLGQTLLCLLLYIFFFSQKFSQEWACGNGIIKKWHQTFLYRRHSYYKFHAFKLVQKLKTTEVAFRKELLRKNDRKKLNDTYIIFSAFCLNLSFRPVKFPDNQHDHRVLNNTSRVQSGHDDWVDGHTLHETRHYNNLSLETC
jgi:hypothetical protein